MVGVLRRDTIVSFMLRLLVKFTVKRRKYRPFPNTIVAAPKNGDHQDHDRHPSDLVFQGMTAWMMVLIAIYGSWALELLGPCVPGVCTFASETGVRVGVVSFKMTCGMPEEQQMRW
jgi:hypothetical protein